MTLQIISMHERRYRYISPNISVGELMGGGVPLDPQDQTKPTFVGFLHDPKRHSLCSQK